MSLPTNPGRIVIMGVLNATPDSFSDGGRYLDLDDAVAHAVQMRAAGADLVDVGGESTRPGAHRVDAAHVGHDDVHGDQVGFELAVFLHRLAPGLRFAHHFKSRLCENIADHRAHEDRVIANEHRMTHEDSSCRR